MCHHAAACTCCYCTTIRGRSTPAEIKSAFDQSKYCNMFAFIQYMHTLAIYSVSISEILLHARQKQDVLVVRGLLADRGKLEKFHGVQKYQTNLTQWPSGHPSLADSQPNVGHFRLHIHRGQHYRPQRDRRVLKIYGNQGAPRLPRNGDVSSSTIQILFTVITVALCFPVRKHCDISQASCSTWCLWKRR